MRCSRARTSSPRSSRTSKRSSATLLIDWVTLHDGVTRRRAQHRRARDPAAHEDDRGRDPARRREPIVAPEPTEVLQAGDRLVVVGRQEDLRRLRPPRGRADVGDELVALGGAFLAAGVLARLGRRIGLPTIPFFMLAGIIFGPNTPGIALVDDPHDARAARRARAHPVAVPPRPRVLARRPARGRRVAARDRRDLPRVEHRRRARVRVRARLGLAGSVGDRGRDRHLVVGDRHQAADRAAPARQSRRAGSSSASSSSRTCSSRCTSRCCSRCSATPTAPLEAIGQFARRVRVPARDDRASRAAAREFVGRLIDDARRRAAHGVLRRPRRAHRRRRRGARRLRRDRRVHDRAGPGGDARSPHRIERLVLPLRDAFAAVFFFAFGLTIDPERRGRRRSCRSLIAVVLSLVLNMIAGLIAARMQRLRPRSGGEHRPDDPRPGRVLVDPRHARRRGRPRRAHRTVRRLLRPDPRARRADPREPVRSPEPAAAGSASSRRSREAA